MGVSLSAGALGMPLRATIWATLGGEIAQPLYTYHRVHWSTRWFTAWQMRGLMTELLRQDV